MVYALTFEAQTVFYMTVEEYMMDRKHD
jgi:hypothetical protein